MDVQHDPGQRRFFMEVKGGDAELRYRRLDDRTIELTHTGVPEEAAGHGIAGKLAKAAFDWARETGTRLVVTCPFVTTWLERHPDQRDLVSPRPTGG